MRDIELRVGQVSLLLDKKMTGSELNALLGKSKSEYHCKYSLIDVRTARLKLKGNYLARKPFVITTHSVRANAGNTVIAANLASSLAWMGFRVLVIDGDSCGDLSRAVRSRVENKRATNIVSIIQGSPLERAIIPIYNDGMLDLISSSPDLSDADIELSLRVTSTNLFLDWVSNNTKYLTDTYDIILVDTCSYPTRLTLNLLAGAKLILGVVRFGDDAPSDARAIKRSMEIIRETQGVSLPPALYVVNGLPPASPQAQNIILSLVEQHSSSLCDVIIPEYAHKKCNCHSVGIIAEREPSSYAAQCFFELAKYIVRHYIETPHNV